jgi:hypothetical protein
MSIAAIGCVALVGIVFQIVSIIRAERRTDRILNRKRTPIMRRATNRLALIITVIAALIVPPALVIGYFVLIGWLGAKACDAIFP